MNHEHWRLFFATDIHGSDVCFKKFINAAKVYDATVLVLGGDITGKAVVPITSLQTGEYRVVWRGEEVRATEAEISEVEQQVRFQGFYPVRMSPDELSQIKGDQSQEANLFRKAIENSICQWLRWADQRLKGTGVKCFISPGNDDADYVQDALEGSETVFHPDRSVVRLDHGIEMLNLGYSNRTPFQTPRELPEGDFLTLIDDLAATVKNPTTSIFNIHCPPFNSGIDLAPELDSSLRIVSQRGQPMLVPVGSTAVRTAIERYQPMLGLHGHVHESRGSVRIGASLCVNPGSTYGEGTLNGAIITFEGDRLVSHQFVTA